MRCRLTVAGRAAVKNPEGKVEGGHNERVCFLSSIDTDGWLIEIRDGMVKAKASRESDASQS